MARIDLEKLLSDGRVKELPVAEIAREALMRLEERGTLVVSAPPGAGKSTLLPLVVATAVEGKVLMLEPRRLAARQIAERMAALLGEKPGQTVGYRIRFESCVSESTRIEVLTEGILTRMLVDDPALEGVSAVIFDEFHERSLTCDEALALTREARLILRPDLRLMIMSATIDTYTICRLLDSPALESSGRMYPVQCIHVPCEGDAASVARIVLKALREQEGDVLAFLPGEAEIRRCAALLAGSDIGANVYPLYGMMPSSEQRRAIAPSAPGERKVVLATPIAETSLTIEGVRVVVDSGLCRKLVFDPQSGLSRLETVRISRDMATQRSGRAGRLAPGVCYRLWSQSIDNQMAECRVPEIMEADLSPLLLDLAAWGEPDPLRLAWLTPPPRQALQQATSLLLSLGALEAVSSDVVATSNGSESASKRQDRVVITPLGKRMAALPCHPRIARMIVGAEKSARSLAADLAAVLEDRDPLPLEPGADLTLRIAALRRYRAAMHSSSHPGCSTTAGFPSEGTASSHPDGASAVGSIFVEASSPSGKDRISGQWKRLIQASEQYCRLGGVRPDDCAPDAYEVGALVALAYPERVAKAEREGLGRYLLSGGGRASLRRPSSANVSQQSSLSRPSSSSATIAGGVGREDYLSASDYLAVASLNAPRGSEATIFLAAPLDPEDVPELIRERDRIVWDSREGGVVARRERNIGLLTVSSRPLQNLPREMVHDVIIAAARKEGTSMFDFSDEVGNLQRRVAAVAQWHPEMNLPDLSTAAVLEHPEQWLGPFLGDATTVPELKKIDLQAALWSILDYPQQQDVERLAPSHIVVPTGSHIRLEYRQGAEAPVLRVRLQECFGLLDTPCVDGGRRPVLMELLSPGFKPVQLTQDLRSFWQSTYFEVRKELRRRYPKHYWPDDPVSASAVRGVKRS